MTTPPPAAALARRALVDIWPAPRRIFSAHPHLFGSAQLDGRADADARFSTIRSGRSVVPVLYGGEDHEAAASETIFHTVDTPAGDHRPRNVWLDKYISWQWSEVVTTRDLALVRLADNGFASLGTTRADLVEVGRGTYPQTRAWGQALAAALPEVDGLWWESRQAPDRWAVVLFGQLRGHQPGGVRPADLTPDGPALPFALAEGLARLEEIADRLGVTVVRS